MRPGRFVVVARVAGGTVDTREVKIGPDEKVELPQALFLRPGAGVIQLEAGGVRPAVTTREPSVTVHALPFGGMTEMQLGLDPTFDASGVAEIRYTLFRVYRETVVDDEGNSQVEEVAELIGSGAVSDLEPQAGRVVVRAEVPLETPEARNELQLIAVDLAGNETKLPGETPSPHAVATSL